MIFKKYMSNTPEVLDVIWFKNNATGNQAVGFVLSRNGNGDFIARCGIGFGKDMNIEAMNIAKFGGKMSEEQMMCFFGATVKAHSVSDVRKRSVSGRKRSK